MNEIAIVLDGLRATAHTPVNYENIYWADKFRQAAHDNHPPLSEETNNL